jgi:SAM-dependent methyltransferase
MIQGKDNVAVDIQRKYYAAAAQTYDQMHLCEEHEHTFALRFLIAAAEQFSIHSILDLGSGTGRALSKFKTDLPHVTAVGIEPSAEMRKIGYSKGLAENDLMDGDAMNLAFPDNSFDIVCEFGILHHVPDPGRAIAEMLRVARTAIFISDNNNFGQGGRIARIVKQGLNALGLWKTAYLLRTGGKGYCISEGDGLAYSFSVFSHYRQIANQCQSVHVLNTRGEGPNLYRSATHVALFGVKKQRA